MEYVAIVCGSFLLSCLAARARHRTSFYIFAFLALMAFTMPAIFRYGIGGDYLDVYMPAIQGVQSGCVTDQEFSFRIVVEAILKMTDEPHWIFVFYSVVTYFIAMLAFPRTGFQLAVLAYLLHFYAFTFSGIRQGLAISFAILSLAMYCKRRYVVSCFVMAAAAFWHYSAVLFIPVVVVLEGVARQKWKCLSYVIALFGVVLYFVDLAKPFLYLARFTPYAKYLQVASYIDSAHMTTGLGYLIPAMMFLSLFYVLYEHDDSDGKMRRLAILCGITYLSYVEAVHLEIMNRFTTLLGAVLPLALAELVRIRNSVRDTLCIVFVLLCLIAMFCKEIIADVNYRITPYTTIFEEGVELW